MVFSKLMQPMVPPSWRYLTLRKTCSTDDDVDQMFAIHRQTPAYFELAIHNTVATKDLKLKFNLKLMYQLYDRASD